LAFVSRYSSVGTPARRNSRAARRLKSRVSGENTVTSTAAVLRALGSSFSSSSALISRSMPTLMPTAGISSPANKPISPS
jgi:hypothetical protein